MCMSQFSNELKAEILKRRLQPFFFLSFFFFFFFFYYFARETNKQYNLVELEFCTIKRNE
jgi:hypothetical protein